MCKPHRLDQYFCSDCIPDHTCACGRITEYSDKCVECEEVTCDACGVDCDEFMEMMCKECQDYHIFEKHKNKNN